MMGVEAKVIGIIHLKIYDDAEKTAEMIDKHLRKLPLNYRIYLQERLDDNPYPKESEGNYVSAEDSD